MVKALAYSLFSLLILLSFPATAETEAAQQGLLWEITAPQLKAPAYLFGTIHSEDERVLALPDPVSAALGRASLFVMEIDPRAAEVELANRRMVLPPEQSLAQLLDGKLYRQTVQTLDRHGLPESVTTRLKPWALVMMLSMPKPRTGHFLDMELRQRAVRQGARLASLESADEQLDVFDGLPLAMQIALLRHTLDQHEQIPAQLEALLASWLRRDLAALQRLGEASNAGLSPEMEAVLQSRLIDERNRRMVARLVPLLDEESVFVAVGALHLPGEQGIIALLRQRGYTVRPIY